MRKSQRRRREFMALLCIMANAMMCIEGKYLHTVIKMRTNIVIDDRLMDDALKATGIATKKEVVEQGLKLLIRHNKQQAIRKLRGKLKWEGDLDEMRGRK